MKKITILFGLYLIPFLGESQSTSDNNFFAGNKFIGYSDNFPLSVRTNGIQRAQFTTNNALNSLVGNNGDGLRILNPTGANFGHLDLFTSATNGANETHIVWGQSGQMSGQATRLEMRGNFDGLWFNTETGAGKMLFNNQNIEYGRLGVNDNWRFGTNLHANLISKVNSYLYLIP